MNGDSPASRREMSELERSRSGDRCESCGAVNGAMVTLGVHVGEPKGEFAHPQPAWLDHWSGRVHGREAGNVLEGGRFIPLQSPLKVTLKAPPQGDASTASDARQPLLCQWHRQKPPAPQD
ncbi:MAG: hypothetical protein JSS14_13435 [Proteobacteria bacterium]|nr:hypothetical protein [Pseudomonadota bacterium]